MAPSRSESEKFDAVVRTLLSVSHEEIQKRDKKENFSGIEKSPDLV